MIQLLTKNSRRLCLSASVLAIVAASASAQTTVLTPTSPNYNLLTGSDQYVELSSGTNGYFTTDNSGADVPAGMVGLLSAVGDGWKNAIGSNAGSFGMNWSLTRQDAAAINVDSGASLTVIGSDYGFYSMFQRTAGDINFGAAHYKFWGSNSFLGNLTLQNGTVMEFGTYEWGCCAFNGSATFGANTNIDMNGGTINFHESPGNMIVGGRISGSAAADIELNSGVLIVNGNYGATGKLYAGTVNIAAGAKFMVGDSTHKTAVFGDTVSKAATINVTGNTATLGGYGTLYGNVTSSGIIVAGGTNGVNGGLTINGNLTQANSGQIYTAITPTGVSSLTVNGTANIAGDLVITVADGTYTNSRYHLVTATNLSGAFANVMTNGNPSGPIIGILKTADGKGYDVLAEGGSATQVFGHVVYANRIALTNFIGSLYDAMATTPATGAKIETFVTPFGSIENLGRDGLGYEEKSYGLTLGGMHHMTSHGGVVGAAFSYRHGNMSVKDDPAAASTNAYSLAVYGGANVEDLRFESSVFYVFNDAGTKRPMGTFGTSLSYRRGYSYGISGQVSHDMFGSLLAPYVRGTYARSHLGSAIEHGAGDYDLRHDAVNINAFVVDLGVRAHLLRPQPDRHLKVDLDLAFRHDLSDPGEKVSVGFANIPGATGIAYWRGDSKNTLRVGLNAADRITDQLEIYSRLDGALTSHRRAGELSAGIKYKF